MPIKLDKQLPAYKILKDKGVFVMSLDRAESQNIRPLRIGLLNLMPKKEETEAQIFAMIGDTPLQVEPVLIKTASYSPKNTSASHMEQFYTTFDEAKKNGLDGLIITGAPIEKLEFKDVAYWQELTQIMDWASQHITSTLYLCWSAQATLYHHYDIQKRPLTNMCFGVFRHSPTVTDDLLMKDIDDEYWVPHSRHSETPEDAIREHPELDVLAHSKEAGVHIVANKNRSEVFMFGHPEYDPETLQNEYRRDKSNGDHPIAPQNYYPNDDDSVAPRVRWRANAAIFYRNWINHVYQTTPFDLYD